MRTLPVLICAAVTTVCLQSSSQVASAEPKEQPELRAGAYVIDVSPTQYPVIVNGMFTERSADRAHDPLQARCLILASGETKLAIVVVDSCGMMREFLDEAKQLAAQATGIPEERILISATHTHSAPSAWPVLGSRVDMTYVPVLIRQIARGIELANKELVPARLGWGLAEDYEDDFIRRWITRPDKPLLDPFGQPTVRAMMHPGFQNPDYIGPAGTIDPAITVLSVQSTAGRPIALLANYSMHYFGSPLLSADYFARFAEEVQKRLKPAGEGPAPVVMMSQGTSGDSMWRDYSRKSHDRNIDEYAASLVERVMKIYEQIKYQERPELGMLETKITLGRRTPSPELLAKSEEIIKKLDGKLPQSRPEVYALEQRYLHEEPRRELKLQVIRIGELGIAAWPNEVFNITGMKLKDQSPLPVTMNIELANGTEGYIPPPEQHLLGGYTTWAARSAGLEAQAEPKILERLTVMLEQLTGRYRPAIAPSVSKYSAKVFESRPLAYWPLDEMSANQARDVNNGRNGIYSGGMAMFLPGAEGPGFEKTGRGNRAVQFVGGHLQCEMPKLSEEYSLEFWAWNGIPNELRDVTGVLCARLTKDQQPGEQLFIAGKGDHAGQLAFRPAGEKAEPTFGKTVLEPKRWVYIALVHDKQGVRVYLNGASEPELTLPGAALVNGDRLLFAAASAELSQTGANLEGKLDEIALFSRALKPEEIAGHYNAGVGPENPK